MNAGQVEKGRDEPTYEDVAERLHLLSLPARLRIVDMLRRREECVCTLQEALGRPQPYVSQQLRVLRKAGIITRRRGVRHSDAHSDGTARGGDDRYVYYRLADPWIGRLVEVALGPADPSIASETGPPSKESRADRGR